MRILIVAVIGVAEGAGLRAAVEEWKRQTQAHKYPFGGAVFFEEEFQEKQNEITAAYRARSGSGKIASDEVWRAVRTLQDEANGERERNTLIPFGTVLLRLGKIQHGPDQTWRVTQDGGKCQYMFEGNFRTLQGLKHFAEDTTVACLPNPSFDRKGRGFSGDVRIDGDFLVVDCINARREYPNIGEYRVPLSEGPTIGVRTLKGRSKPEAGETLVKGRGVRVAYREENMKNLCHQFDEARRYYTYTVKATPSWKRLIDASVSASEARDIRIESKLFWT
jgi:hypothetical protein